ncbi:phosphoribosylanthranilate isomerase [Blattabacterium sp. (Cryptocercus kyebangensis)]|uniref:phosphoribosylanthranilate isomerase n=1 Tax=Blattabacterium sp. (Cryptocercus kyebangensis) TaxID=298656 RepID=UPI001F1B7FE6|nr:phosphoribosylanthranilate isomerase [Blattabacterium sp. (Cryptocercus kyebangensis)]
MKFNILEISDLFPDFIGFIFYPNSPRFVGYDFSPPKLKRKILKTGVFVNESKEKILKISKEKSLDFVQLHGNESSFYCEYLFNKGLKLIKSFRIDKFLPFKNMKDYIHLCTYFLFDTKTTSYGGSGKKFCWDLLYEYNLEIPFFLSGGIGIEDIDKIKNFSRSNSKMFGIDINSKFEFFPGKKDSIAINSFIKKIRK